MGSVPSLVPAPFLLMSGVRLFKKKNECGSSHTETTFLEAALSAQTSRRFSGAERGYLSAEHSVEKDLALMEQFFCHVTNEH